MKKLDHKNIVKQDLAIDTTDFILIVLEYCDQGNLLTYQARLPGKVFPLEHALRVLVEVLKGLRCIHERNFIHRDIKSENILLKKGEGGEVIYKIADFGFARSIGGVGAKTHCGTEKYMAPEIISNSYYGISVDIWALGVLFYFMLFAEYPFKGKLAPIQATT
jgi:serine/threonine protein kinase